MFDEVKNLIFVDQELAEKKLKSLVGEIFIVEDHFLKDEEKNIICKFDHCRAGNNLWNAVSIIRDMHNSLNPSHPKTRKQVEQMIKINYQH